MAVELEMIVRASLQASGVDRERAVVIAVSGGSDSCALLFAVSTVLTKPDLVIAHYNHALRTPAEHNEERKHVQRIALQSGIDARFGKAYDREVRRVAHDTGSGIESAARVLRYRFLSSVAAEVGASTVLTAHTADDQAETILMGLLRDVAPIGLTGIPSERSLSPATRVIRPMLTVTRSCAEHYLESRGVSWVSDSSNANERYFRNHVRLTLLPALVSTWPGIRGLLLDLADDGQAIRKAAYLEAEELRWHSMASQAGREYSLDAKIFFEATPSARLAALWRLAADAGLIRPDSRPPIRFFAPLLGERPKGSLVLLSGRGIRVSQLGGRLIWCSSVVRSEESGYFSFVEANRPVCLPGGWELTLRRGTDHDSPELGSVVHLPTLQEPVIIRLPRPGDVITTPSGRRLVADVIADLGIARDLRGSVPILADRIGIAAVIGSVAGAANVVDMASGEREQKEPSRLVVRGAR